MRSIKAIHKAISSPIDDLITYRALPTNTISMERLNPFIFLNHHGPQQYPSNNNGLPFGPHPHRGMETVTFILDGDILHKDSYGHESIISAGGIQWMTAGRGLIHAEVSSDEFKRSGGKLEILQLWLNLPAKFKMKDPFYKGLQEKDIPKIKLNGGSVTLNLISGEWENTHGAIESVSNIFLSTIHFKSGAKFSIKIPEEKNIFFYVVRGTLRVNKKEISAMQLVEFNHDGTDINIESSTNSVLILGYADPLNEPIVAQGPFVMNTEREIMDSYNDYKKGKFGSWQG